jgi:polar amino acid transport system substrate-binding protein
MRTLHLIAASSALVASLATVSGVATAAVAHTAPTAAATCTTANASSLHSAGHLTVATDSPAYTPWFVNNKPSNGKGYESAVAYAIASQMGFSASKVKWAYEPFSNSYQPGSKAFDFDLNEISVTPDRSAAVSFSNSYYDVTQSIIALKKNPIVIKHSPAQLKTYQYGDMVGTTGLDYINNEIQPTKQVKVYSSLTDAFNALVAKQVDAIVVDTPDGQYAVSKGSGELPDNSSVQVGQFPSVGEHFGALFTKDNPLVGCVNDAIADLQANGTLAKISKQYLGIYNKVPQIQP